MNIQQGSNTLSKSERLNGEKRISALFSSSNSFVVYPLRVVYLLIESDDPQVAMMVSVSKKKFKRAVKRNRMKRLMRESYRKNKQEYQKVAQNAGQSIDIAFLYLKNELADYDEVAMAMIKAADVLNNKANGENK